MSEAFPVFFLFLAANGGGEHIIVNQDDITKPGVVYEQRHKSPRPFLIEVPECNPQPVPSTDIRMPGVHSPTRPVVAPRFR